MGQSIISWRRIKQLNRKTGEAFIHASTREHNSWHCVRYDGTAAWVDTRTLDVAEDLNGHEWYSTNLLRGVHRGELTTSDLRTLIEWTKRHLELQRSTTP